MLVQIKTMLTVLACVILLIYVNDCPGRSYYLSTSGNNKNDGSINNPFKSIAYLNTIKLKAGDTIFLKANESFSGSLILDSTKSGIKNKPIVITSYGNGNAIINGGNESAIAIYNSSYANVCNLICEGSGRKNGNTKNGVAISNCGYITLENIAISGFQKAGLLVYSSFEILISSIHAYENGFAGIAVDGDYDKRNSEQILIKNCLAENNPGDPSNLTNHSGNGIIIGSSKNVTIEYCVATNNGWDMPRIGNGPVGIWCYESDSVVIQHCISYKNKTSKGGEDGGGYDLDGGVTNSIIQYCLSYENQGSGFGIFQYAGASDWHDNTIRYCISENDGNVSAAHANIYVWNSSHDSTQFKNLFFYNNTIYNNKGAAISYSIESDHSNFNFYNNIFVAANNLMSGTGDDVFLANDWWSLKVGFNIKGEQDFHNWALKNNKEQLDGKLIGLNIDPAFKNAGNANLTDADQLNNFDNYKIIRPSLIMIAGIDLDSLFKIQTGEKDFNGLPPDKKYIGACSH
ncbi:MAG: right-handed parallel beta-helix repeat-containing protein [Ginsengibacter sp.]